jgi:hypothetical protein
MKSRRGVRLATRLASYAYGVRFTKQGYLFERKRRVREVDLVLVHFSELSLLAQNQLSIINYFESQPAV